MKTCVCFIATAVFVAPGLAVRAAPITYNFNGTVTQLGLPQMGSGSAAGVKLGDDIPILISVNDPGTGGPNYFDQGIQPPPLFASALFNGVNYTSQLNYINIQVGSSINFFTTVPHSNYGFDLLLNGARNGALATGALPTSLSPGDFTGGTFSVIQSFNTNNAYSGTIDGIGGINITPAPEPASWLLLSAGSIVAAWGAAWQAARRRRMLAAELVTV